jgi:hypothetical protein
MLDITNAQISISWVVKHISKSIVIFLDINLAAKKQVLFDVFPQIRDKNDTTLGWTMSAFQNMCFHVQY